MFKQIYIIWGRYENPAALDRLFSVPSSRQVLSLLEEEGALALLYLIVDLGSPNKGHEYLYAKCNAKVLLIYQQAPSLYFIPLISLIYN